MKSIKEQIKTILKKTIIWQRRQKNREENNDSAKDNISTMHNKEVQTENKNVTIKESLNLIPNSEKAKMMFHILKREDSSKEINKTEAAQFENKQMYNHLHDIFESIHLKLANETTFNQDNFKITFQNKLIPIDSNTLEIALAYEELNKTYRLEAKTLIELLLVELVEKDSNVTENFIINFLNEIIKQKKLQTEKELFKGKIVWLKP